MRSSRPPAGQPRMRLLTLVAVLGGGMVAACSSAGAPAATTIAISQPSAATTAAATTTPVATSIPTASTSSTSTTTTSPMPPSTTAAPVASTTTSVVAVASTTATPPPTAPSTTTTTTTTTATSPVHASMARTIGTSLEGRPITATRRGTPGGHVVLVVGVIHGDEDAGTAITDQLATAVVPDGVDLWIVGSMNPDGQAAGDRHNAAQVDLNRNFPYAWAPLGRPGSPEYAGTGPASEPETQAMVAFVTEIQPEMVIWYHQDLDRIAPASGRDGRIRARYAELTGVPLLRITGGTYTGVAATWARQELGESVAFIVELGPTLDAAQAAMHAAAVLTVATEL